MCRARPRVEPETPSFGIFCSFSLFQLLFLGLTWSENLFSLPELQNPPSQQIRNVAFQWDISALIAPLLIKQTINCVYYPTVFNDSVKTDLIVIVAKLQTIMSWFCSSALYSQSSLCSAVQLQLYSSASLLAVFYGETSIKSHMRQTTDRQRRAAEYNGDFSILQKTALQQTNRNVSFLEV